MAETGGVVYFPAGEYLINRVRVPNNVAVVGDGKNETILNWKATAARQGDALIASSGTTVVIAGLALVNDYKWDDFSPALGSAPIGVMISLSNAAPALSGIGGYMLKDVKAINAYGGGSGVSLSGPRPGTIEDCQIEAYSCAVDFGDGLRIPTLKNSYTFNRQHANISNHSDGMYIHNSVIEGDSKQYEAERIALQAYRDGVEPVYPYPGMRAGDSEHRYIDAYGDEWLFIGNTTQGHFAGWSDNSGEGICMQGMSASLIGTPVSATPKTLVTGSSLATIARADNYVQIIAGPGIGQIRKVLHMDEDANGTLVLEQPWDIVPTADTTYIVTHRLIANHTFADNLFNANISKGDIYLYRSYDTVIANNRFTGGGAGLWLSAFGGHSNHYFATLYNNLYENECHHYMSIRNKQMGVGGSDGSIDVRAYGSATSVYGFQFIRNQMWGTTTEPYPPMDDEEIRFYYQIGWWPAYGELAQAYERYNFKNGLHIGDSKSAAANTWGSVVDGNKINNTSVGLFMGTQVHDTVVRNNDFSGNKYETQGYDRANRVFDEFDDVSEAPGRRDLTEIDKTALEEVIVTPVNKDALAAAVVSAEANLASVLVSADGKDVNPADLWVTAGEKAAYQIAINAAKGILSNGDATQADVDAAAAALNAATDVFNAAKKAGTYEPPVTEVKVSDAKTGVKDFISMTETAKNSRVWELAFHADVTYTDGLTVRVRYAIRLAGNNANLDGKYVFEKGHELEGWTLTYDVKGNGSNIKAMKLTK